MSKPKLKATWKAEFKQDLECYKYLFHLSWKNWIFHPIKSYKSRKMERELINEISDAIREEIDRQILEQIIKETNREMLK